MEKIGAKESRKNKKKKMTASDVVLIVIFVVAITVAAVSGYKLYSIMMEYKAGVDEYNEIADTVVKERDADAEDVKKLKDAKGHETKHWTSPLEINFDELKSINQDVAGWLYMEALPNINYPIVQGSDNDFYLHHTYKKESIFAGSIFVDCKNTKDFSDQNTIVYGHNMKNGSMFGTLKQYKLQETIDKSPYFWVITPKEAYKYKIFAMYVANVDGDTYTLIKGPGKETIEYGESMKAKSLINTGDYQFKQTDKIVTLSTCTGDSSTRFVGFVISSIIPWLFSMIGEVILQIVLISRILELVVMVTFAPLSISDIYREGTASPGVQYMKRVLALSLQVIVIILINAATQAIIFAIINKGSNVTIGQTITDILVEAEYSESKNVALANGSAKFTVDSVRTFMKTLTGQDSLVKVIGVLLARLGLIWNSMPLCEEITGAK